MIARSEVFTIAKDYFFGAASADAVFVSALVVVVFASAAFVEDAFEQHDALLLDSDFAQAALVSFEQAALALAPSHARAGAIAIPKQSAAAANIFTAFMVNSLINKVKQHVVTHSITVTTTQFMVISVLRQTFTSSHTIFAYIFLYLIAECIRYSPMILTIYPIGQKCFSGYYSEKQQ